VCAKHERHLACFAHTLNLCVHDGLSKDEHLTLLLTNCRSIVTYFKRSNNAMDLLKKEQDRMGKPHLKLLKYCYDFPVGSHKVSLTQELINLFTLPKHS